MTFFWFVKYHHGNIPFCIFRSQSPVITLLMLVYRNLVADIDLLTYDQTRKLVPVQPDTGFIQIHAMLIAPKKTKEGG